MVLRPDDRGAVSSKCAGPKKAIMAVGMRRLGRGSGSCRTNAPIRAVIGQRWTSQRYQSLGVGQQYVQGEEDKRGLTHYQWRMALECIKIEHW